MILPISGSLFAEIVPTCAISFRPLLGADIRFSSSTTNSTALSMPRFSDIGLAPAVTDFSPSRKIACARTVAVVVPSPTISEVLVATSFTICAPMFSISSSSSISFTTVTPSFVIVGFLDQDDLFLLQLDLRAGVLPVHDPVADLQLHRDPLALFQPAGPDRDDLTLDRLLLGCVRDVETTFHLLGLF